MQLGCWNDEPTTAGRAEAMNRKIARIKSFLEEQKNENIRRYKETIVANPAIPQDRDTDCMYRSYCQLGNCLSCKRLR